MLRSLDIVFLDIGGVLYDDGVYADAWKRALRAAGASFTDPEFDAEYTAARQQQSRSFRARLAERFLGADPDLARLERLAARWWDYPPDALYADVLPCLESLTGTYRLGVIANQLTSVRDALRRDGLLPFFEVWAISADLGMQKPDPELFVHALATADVEPGRAVMVGDRLDYDIRPAAAAGMRTVWVLRGEAPDRPTPEQLMEPDASITDLTQLPASLEAFVGVPRRGIPT